MVDLYPSASANSADTMSPTSSTSDIMDATTTNNIEKHEHINNMSWLQNRSLRTLSRMLSFIGGGNHDVDDVLGTSLSSMVFRTSYEVSCELSSPHSQRKSRQRSSNVQQDVLAITTVGGGDEKIKQCFPEVQTTHPRKGFIIKGNWGALTLMIMTLISDQSHHVMTTLLFFTTTVRIAVITGLLQELEMIMAICRLALLTTLMILWDHTLGIARKRNRFIVNPLCCIRIRCWILILICFRLLVFRH
jgi:hypothetical protein